ncbi:MAG: RecX family transcriptional regulator [Chloroflexi bacterium]|nr:RecX family transcriptional regulator [Chloroflexota bacterium]
MVETVLAQLRRYRLVDDQAFAERWVEQRQALRPRGARLLRAELVQHGIARAGAEAATSQLGDSAREDAYRAAARRAAQLRDLDDKTFTSRLSQWLARRGFDWDTIAPVVARLQVERIPAAD